MKLYSFERSTGRGASHWTGLWVENQFVPLSKIPGTVHLGRVDGFEIYCLDWSPERDDFSDARGCIRYRSNSSLERVLVAPAMMIGGAFDGIVRDDPLALAWTGADYLIDQVAPLIPSRERVEYGSLKAAEIISRA